MAVLASSCGGGAGGSVGSGGSGQGLILLSFQQDGLDNIALNTRLELRFSDVLNPATVTSQTIHIRRGPSFGLTVGGRFVVDGAVVLFEPDLPSVCDLSDSGFEADVQYRVQLSGFPEEFSIRTPAGQPLNTTSTFEFHTRPDTDPKLFTDQFPGSGPSVVSASPANGAEAVAVQDGNKVVLTISENLKPCSVNPDSVRFHIYQFGDPATMAPSNGGTGLATGFATPGGDTSDQDLADPHVWGTPAQMPGVTTLPQPQLILAHIELNQSFDKTELVVTPDNGYNANPLLNKSRFPENALVVLELTFEVVDFGGVPLQPFTLSFTTQNLPPQDGAYVVENEGETPWDETLTTAQIIEEAPGLIQGFMLFSGDGDNGADPLRPSLPQQAPVCMTDLQANDGTADDFEPTGDVLLDTGSSVNQCVNQTDGSYAVVWEFKTLHIPNGVTVRIIGVNPAILLVQGDATIDAGARILARADNKGGAPKGEGEGGKNSTTTAGCKGGIGVAGGGGGGASPSGSGSSANYGKSGVTGYFHTTPTGPLNGDVGAEGGAGGGEGNTSAYWSTQSNPNNRNTPSGGGGGHATKGGDGMADGSGSSPTKIDLALKGGGGGVYGDSAGKMITPEAGSGGGAGGEVRPFTGTTGRGPGGAGGAGGGFIDVTAGGDLTVLGTIDAAGSKGGSNPGGTFNPNYSWQPGAGGGGGGSGGGIRLLTPKDLIVGPTTVITTAGGAGGAGGATQGNPASPKPNAGGNGGVGRIALEDSNSVITGIAGATVTPGEGAAGFYRGVFDSTRFKGGGLSPSATTEVFAVGPFNPTYQAPIQAYPSNVDFRVGAPSAASPGAGKTVMLVEVKGYQMLPDGTVDLAGVIAPPTPWHTVGYFKDSGIETQPTWVAGQPPLAEIGGSLPDGNTGVQGIDNIDGCEYIQIRVSLYLATTVTPNTPGHYLDRWTINFTSDN